MSLSMLKQAVLNDDEEEKIVPETVAPELPLEKPEPVLSGIDLLDKFKQPRRRRICSEGTKRNCNQFCAEAALRLQKTDTA